MKNKKNFLTRCFSPLLLLIIFTLSSNLPSYAYWHRVYKYNDDDNGTVIYNVTGDSSALYASVLLIGTRTRIVKSTNIGRTWETIYNYYDAPYPPYKGFEGMQHPTPSYMYLLYSGDSQYVPDGEANKGTGIIHLDERTGKVVNSIAIELEVGQTKYRDFFMIDSLNGLIYNAWFLSITRDGWKSFTQSDTRNCVYDEEKKEFIGLSQGMKAPVMLSPDSVFCISTPKGGSDPTGFFLAIIGEGDTTFTFEPLGHGYNIEITEDSTHFLTSESEILYKRANNFAYINDSTWLYTAPGHGTGYGSCNTLEILKTINRGKSYYQVCSLDVRAYGVQRIYFKDSLNGIATGNGVTLLTNDCGENWRVDTTVYDFDWTVPKPSYFWNLRVSYVDNMTFLTSFGAGVFKYEEVFGTMDVVEENSLFKNSLLYPNPIQAGNTLNFKIPQLISGRAFIYDIYGNKIQDSNFFGNSIQLRSDIVAGTYFLVIGDMNEEIIMRSKFIVR